MKVNGIDLKEKYGSKIIIGQQTIRERTIVTFTDWIDEYDRPTPGMEAPKGKFYDVEAEAIIRGTSKKDAELTVSNIISDCMSGTIELDNMELELQGELKEAEKEFLTRWNYSLKLIFRAWDKAESEVSITTSNSGKTIDVEGNQETPCIIELTPSGAITTYTIKGAARDPVTGEAEDIVIKNLSAGKTVIIDGEACTVTEDGANKYADTEMWEFPTLVPGSNILTFVSSSVSCSVTIKYKPRYI